MEFKIIICTIANVTFNCNITGGYASTLTSQNINSILLYLLAWILLLWIVVYYFILLKKSAAKQYLKNVLEETDFVIFYKSE